MKFKVYKPKGVDWQKFLAGNGTALVIMAIIGLFRLDPKVAHWQTNGLWVAASFLTGIFSLFIAIIYYPLRDGIRWLKNYYTESNEKHSVQT